MATGLFLLFAAGSLIAAVLYRSMSAALLGVGAVAAMAFMPTSTAGGRRR